MLEKWIGDVVGKMRVYGITRQDLAEAAGVSETWVSKVLNGKRTSQRAKKQFTDAVEAVIQAKKVEAERGAKPNA